ncbi:uncharacterized protein LOC114362169 [Ostrinia furnacalis]|uniref:uncharacterized protein LOC114362169 n=1 Tax=Ostrinia furnacalis TaxID=93504 RepID=UPI00103CEB9E|nr:uncharacterized protein LOC114362169 [Ostrinia furnacalis]
MDLASDKTPGATGMNGPVELIVAYGHRLKLHRVNSKDKLNNAFVSNTVDHEKKRSVSKLPRVKKAPLYSNVDKNAAKPFVHLDNSGDTIAGPSKPKHLPQRTRRPSPRSEPEKTKPSHIPRRKTGSVSPTPKHNTSRPDSSYFGSDSPRIQRLQVPNIPDFHQDDHIPTTSRPIPTLGQIYRRNNIIIDGDRFYDWFMELDTPVNSLESNPRNTQRSSTDSADTAQSVINVEINKPCFGETVKPKVVFGANVYKTTNDNISNWLSSELEYPNKDNESGYRSMSPHSRGAINIESKSDENVKQSNENYCLGLAKTSEYTEPSEREASNENNIGEPFENAAFEPSDTAVKDMPLVEQPTVVISRLHDEDEPGSVFAGRSVNKVDKGLGPIVICRSEFSKNLQFPSMTVADSKDEKQAFAPSYVECPSEILQKTTNFEGDGIESPKTLSSLACTDLEIHDDYSSQYTLENVDDCNLEDQATTAWCPACRSQSCMTFIKSEESENTALQNSFCGCRGDKSEVKASVVDSDSKIHREKLKYCRLCGRRNSLTLHGDVRKYCKKHSRYRRFPSYRYKIARPFDTLRKHLSITRICRHRWNHVWKKTAARWAHRSKSHSKLGKFRMLEYLQSSIIWEDVDVQTLTLVYRETGTHTNVMQQKSAGISAFIKQCTSAKKTDTGGVGTSAKSFKSRFKQINLGPSRFPFFYNSKRKSMPLKKVDESSKTIHRFFSYPENQNKFVEAVESTRSRNDNFSK